VIAQRWRREAATVASFGVLILLVYRPIFSGCVIAGVDAFQLAIPDASFLLDCLRGHEWPLWTPYERLGQPFAGQLQTQAFYLPRVLTVLVAGPYWGITIEQVFHAAVSCAGGFIACRLLGRSWGASFVASAAFALGPMCTELANVPNLAGAAAWSGAMLAAALYLERNRSARAGVLLAVVAAASLMTGSPETWLWQAAAIFIVVGPRGRHVAAMAFAFMLAAVVILPTAEFLQNSIRFESVPGQFDWSAPTSSLLAIFWLNADLPRPVGEQHLVACLFQGSVMIALAVAAAWTKGPSRRLLIFGAGLALLALGDHFAPARWVLSVPPLSLFRYPVKYLVGASFCFSIAAAAGLDHLRSLRATKFVLVVPITIPLLLALHSFLPVRATTNIGLGWAAVFLLGAVGAFLLPRGERRADVVGFGLGALALAELAVVSFLWGTPMWLSAADLARSSKLAGLLPRPEQGRVSVEVSNTERLAWGSAGAFAEQSRDNLIPLRNVEEHVAIVEGYGPPEPRDYSNAAREDPRALHALAGVTHVLRATVEGSMTLSAAPPSLPRAFLSDALTDCRSEPPVWKSYRATSLEIEVNACAQTNLVVTDAWYPGWFAEVDGQPTAIVRAQQLVRSVEVPAGEHVVRMQYRPASFAWGAALSFLGAIVAVLVVAFRRTA
jgi:hypothetical protein